MKLCVQTLPAPENATPVRLMDSTMGMDTRRWRQSAVLSPVQIGPTLCVCQYGRVGGHCGNPGQAAQRSTVTNSSVYVGTTPRVSTMTGSKL